MPNTSGGEYVCQAGFDNFPGCGDGPNGTYIGFYHTHPNKGPMAGAQHSTQPHPLLMNVGSYQKGGLLRGPSHEQGGIPARVGGSTGELVELEGDEYIINAQSAKALGTEFLDKINSTATTHHQGGFPPGRLPSPSQYKRGGKVMRKRMKRGGRAANKYYDPYKFAGGGRPERKAPECGGQCLTIRDCNPGCRCAGSTAGTYGTCVPRAAQFRRRQPMARGGRVRNRRMQYGGSPTPMRTTGTRRVGRIGSSGNNVLGHFNGGKRQKGPGQF